MIGSNRLGVFVGILGSRGILGLFISAFLIIGVSACSDPDDRSPWPTAQVQDETENENIIPQQALGFWKSSCIQFENESRSFEVELFENAEFSAIEYFYNEEGCAVARDRRVRKGRIDSVLEVGDQAWHIKTHMYEHNNPGDLMEATTLVKMIDGKIHIHPISATLSNVGDEVHKDFQNDEPTVWVLEQIQ